MNESDTLQAAQSTAYDSIWAASDIPTKPPTPLEQVMLSDDKILVVLAVVLLIWIGIMFMIWRTDRRIAELERTVDSHIGNEDPL
jgi:hypothetical protein